jgi:hypothetical protein
MPYNKSPPDSLSLDHSTTNGGTMPNIPRTVKIEVAASLIILSRLYIRDSGRVMDRDTWDSLTTSVRETVETLVDCGIPVTTDTIIDFVTLGGK